MHYETLSLFQNPWAYFAWLLNRGSLVLAAIICFKFFRASRRTLWLALGVGFLAALALTAVDPMRHGLPPLPYAQVSDPVDLPPTRDGLSFSRTIMHYTQVPWDASSYLLTIALCFAWRQYRANQISARI